MGVRGELFSTKVALQNRTYFFNVKENRMGDLYLNIVESKNREAGGFERQSLVLFADDLREFLSGFDESLRVLEKATREKRKGENPRGTGKPDSARKTDSFKKSDSARKPDSFKKPGSGPKEYRPRIRSENPDRQDSKFGKPVRRDGNDRPKFSREPGRSRDDRPGRDERPGREDRRPPREKTGFTQRGSAERDFTQRDKPRKRVVRRKDPGQSDYNRPEKYPIE